MNHQTLQNRLYKLERYSKEALRFIPKKSKYRTWVYKLLAEELGAEQFVQLEKRIKLFWGEDYK